MSALRRWWSVRRISRLAEVMLREQRLAGRDETWVADRCVLDASIVLYGSNV